jgi:anti-sigma factor RsiW
MTCGETTRLLDAYVDNELDVRGVLEVEEHLARCVQCASDERGLRDLSASVRTNLTRHPLPPELEERLRAAIRAEAPAEVEVPIARLRPRRWAWAVIPAAAAAAAVVVAIPGIGREPPDRALADSVVTAHVRSLLANHLTDVASSDQHTVKPWFQGKLDYSVSVTDFAPEGFPLAGGRLDYVGDTTAAALVYRRAQHVINLFVWPRKDGGDESPRRLCNRGYCAYRWAKDGMSYWAVSDLNDADLQQFVELVRQRK